MTGSERDYRPELAPVAFHSSRIEFARIHPVFCTSLVENDRHSILLCSIRRFALVVMIVKVRCQ